MPPSGLLPRGSVVSVSSRLRVALAYQVPVYQEDSAFLLERFETLQGRTWLPANQVPAMVREDFQPVLPMQMVNPFPQEAAPR